MSEIKHEEVFNHVDFSVLQELLDKQEVTDISCKNQNEVWVTSNKCGHYRTDTKISSQEIERIVNQIANKMHKQFNPAFPSLEGDIQSTSVDYRIAAVHNSLSVNGTCLSIRKVRKTKFLDYDKLIASKYIKKSALDSLILAVKGRANIVILGATGSGKTELLKFLASYIPSDEVIVTIEDSLEFNNNKINPNLSCTSFRINNNFDYSEIIAMSLRLNVKRILLQEARGKEVKDLIDAMSTGHNVMTTMHARSASVLVTRIKQMLLDSSESFDSLKKRIYSLVDIVVYIDAINGMDGIYRRVDSITELIYDPKNDESSEKTIYTAQGGRTFKFSNTLSGLINNNLRGRL